MYCHRCGTLLPDEANFCQTCGANVAPLRADVPPANQSSDHHSQTQQDVQPAVKPVVAMPPTSNIKLLLVRHILGMALVGLINGAVWRSPTFMFGSGVWLALWIPNIVIAAIVTAIGYAFFTEAMKTRWVSVFLWAGWIFTALALFGRLLT